jgi:probable addiction module antidote protein
MPKRVREHQAWLLERLLDPAVAAEYLNEAREESRKSFLKALRNVAEARRMAVVAQEAGVNRESLYRTLSEEGNPRLDTYDSLLDALGLDYTFIPKETNAKS